MFLPFSWVIPAMISFSYINAHTLNVWTIIRLYRCL